ncbi:competence-and mitomycin-induced protein [Corynebacterium renale]|uniref:CinA family protein n=1 Tax=Corynebacterium renale TaxID=1724 RepID=UPI000DA3F15D|nr:CinA family protein [Corynebacterium renale]SQG64866.1 competence-and mitomycin-induced protein [Corynebacterium renale]STC96472.1 competence-and mitomycin-induced protein [Corynebacterium renale]
MPGQGMGSNGNDQVRSNDLISTAQELVAALSERHETVATCESLTAGLAGATIASIPGASAVFRGGLITYATALKNSLAGVPRHVLDSEGPVSAVTARYMASGAREKCASTWALSFTGVAGPAGQDGHPVGEVWVGISGPEDTRSYTAASVLGVGERLRGGREDIRNAAVLAGLTVLLNSL